MADDINSLLQQAGLLGPQASSNQQSGLLAALDPYGGASQLGLSLLANAGGSPYRKPLGQIIGQSALQSQQQAQQNALNQIAIAQGTVGLGSSIQKQQAINEWLKAQQAQGQPGQPQSGMPQSPQGGLPPPMLQMAGNGYDPRQPGTAAQAQQPQQAQSPQQGDLSQIPINGMDPNLYRRLAVLQGKDPLETDKQIRALQLQTAQQALAPQLAKFDNAIKSDSPTREVGVDPQLQQVWQQFAQQRPGVPFTDATARVALTMARNQLAAPAQLPSEAPPLQMRTVTLPDGRTAQIDPMTGKVNIEAPSPVKETVGANGKPVFTPTALTPGKTPYNQLSTATDDDLQSTAEQIAAYKVAPPTGSKLLSGNWPGVMKLVKQINPDYDATQYGAKVKARNSFATGKQGDITRSLSVATDHLDQLSTAADALKNGGLPAANKVANFFSQQTGNAAVTNFDAMKEIVGDEVVKAVVGSTGAAGDREAIKKSFSAANSPAQLQGVIQKYKGLMGGQLNGLRRQYEKNTGLKDFDDMVSDSAQSQLSGGSHPYDIQSLLDKYK